MKKKEGDKKVDVLLLLFWCVDVESLFNFFLNV